MKGLRSAAIDHGLPLHFKTAAADLWKDLAEKAKKLFGIELSDDDLRRLADFVSLVQTWSTKVNLLSAETMEEIVYRHVLDSLAPARWIGPAGMIADFGSGAGFPGIPLGLVKPSVRMWLIESRRRRANFLRHVVRVLKLHNVMVYEGRAEEFAKSHRSEFGAAIGRAISPELLVRFALEVVEPGGRVVLMRKAGAAVASVEGFTQQGREEYELPGGFLHEVIILARERMNGSFPE